MLYRKLGKTGLSVSILSFGTMRLPISSANPDFTEAIALISYANAKGINYFDVGTFYCHNYAETAFGMATKDIARENILISGKNSSHQSGFPDWRKYIIFS
ncbi:MAG: aldo/keto reductase [bacterium]